MSASPQTAPRRKLHRTRWLVVFVIALFAWSGWRVYAFRSALAQAKALGWEVTYTDPAEVIRADWKAAFKKETWTDGVTDLSIGGSEAFEQHITVVHRLNPRELRIDFASTLRDLSDLRSLTRLQVVWLYHCKALTNVDALKNLPSLEDLSLAGCTRLTNIDALENLSALHRVWLDECTSLTNVDGLTGAFALKRVFLTGCTGLPNVDALKSLSSLQKVTLYGCTGLTPQSVAALRAALPNAEILGP